MDRRHPIRQQKLFETGIIARAWGVGRSDRRDPDATRMPARGRHDRPQATPIVERARRVIYTQRERERDVAIVERARRVIYTQREREREMSPSWSGPAA